MRLGNRRILITGGASSIGLETGKRFVAQGAQVGLSGPTVIPTPTVAFIHDAFKFALAQPAMTAWLKNADENTRCMGPTEFTAFVTGRPDQAPVHQPTHADIGGLDVWDFEKRGRKVNVRERSDGEQRELLTRFGMADSDSP